MHLIFVFCLLVCQGWCYTVVRPQIYHHDGETKIQLHSGDTVENLILKYDLDDHSEHVIDLHLSRDLLTSQYLLTRQQDGSRVEDAPSDELCHYRGHVRDKEGSWAAVSTCGGLISGAVFDGQEMHYLEPKSSTTVLLYNRSDFPITNHTCGHNDSQDHILSREAVLDSGHRNKRGTNNIEPRPPRYLELLLVVDHEVYKQLGRDVARVQHRCKDIVHVANALYAPLNLHIALVGVVVWSERNEINLSSDGDQTLTNFLRYRRQHQPFNDNAHLLTNEQFEGGATGKALKGPICTYEFSGGVLTDGNQAVGLLATILAHNIGHNLGMDHDRPGCTCKGSESCLMAPKFSKAAPADLWSDCSEVDMDNSFKHGMDHCLKNKPISLFDGPTCGNGLVEEGEQCDCGLPAVCNNQCCNTDTCMMHLNATCATGECCDLATCAPKPAGSACRASRGECDLTDRCTGDSERCPEDVYRRDGEQCAAGDAYCYHGACITHTQQCQLLWGPSGRKAHDRCYEGNVRGTRNGNCGMDLRNFKSYTKCDVKDVQCGMLHCQHQNERLEYGMESVAILSHQFIAFEGEILHCRSAIVDLGLADKDPGLVPDGSKCGDGQMCVSQKCVTVASHAGLACPHHCHSHGVCDNKGHCHCDPGFELPFCDTPGSSLEQEVHSTDTTSTTESEEVCNQSDLLLVYGYLYIPCVRGSYKVYAQAHNWTRAKERCEEDGTHLAVIDTRAEQEILRKLLKSGNTASVWIGHHRVNSAWISVSGAILNSNDVKWIDCPGIDGAGLMTEDSTGLSIADKRLKHAFICELES